MPGQNRQPSTTGNSNSSSTIMKQASAASAKMPSSNKKQPAKLDAADLASIASLAAAAKSVIASSTASSLHTKQQQASSATKKPHPSKNNKSNKGASAPGKPKNDQAASTNISSNKRSPSKGPFNNNKNSNKAKPNQKNDQAATKGGNSASPPAWLNNKPSSNSVKKPASSTVSKTTVTAKNDPSPTNTTSQSRPKTTSTVDKKAAILKEMKALGGTDEDLELLDGIWSGSEVDDEELASANAAAAKKAAPADKKAKKPVNDNALQRELESFMKASLQLNPGESNLLIVESEDEQEDVEENEQPAAPGNNKNPAKLINQKFSSTPSLGDIESKLSTLVSSSSSLKGNLLLDPTPNWFEVALPALPDLGALRPEDEPKVARVYEKAKEMYEAEVKRYEQRKDMSKSDKSFLSTVLTSGTTTDKISALTLLIQESPLHTLPLLRDHLLPMTRKKARREALLALDAVKDLATTGLLPPTRKLIYFRDRNLFHPSITPRHLIQFFFEDSLKKTFFTLLQTLEDLSKDPLPHVRSKVLHHITDLLSSKPEQEANLLSLLVNKLGDTERKISAKASHLLLNQVLTQHPVMQGVVVGEVERFLFRQGVSPRAQYVGVCVLNQMVLSKKEEGKEVGAKLVAVYFRFFEGLVKRAAEGVSSNSAAAKGGKKGDLKGKKGGKKGGKKDAKKMRPKQMTAEEAMKDDRGQGIEFVDVSDDDNKNTTKSNEMPSKPQSGSHLTEIDGIDAKLMAALLTGLNRAFPYAEIEEDVFEKQMEVLYKICHVSSFNIAVQALTLIYQVQSSRQSVTDRFYRTLYATLHSPHLPNSSKHSMYLNLLHRALKADHSLERIQAFIKRLIQTCGGGGVGWCCAVLYLVGDLGKHKPGVWGMVEQPEEGADGDDDVEKFVDADEEGNNPNLSKAPAETKIDESNAPPTNASKYDPRKRDPLHAHAGSTCLWELPLFKQHFHPTVQLYASTLLQSSQITVPEGAKNYDPLQNHTLARFLDRFVYKNPKKVKSVYKGSSLMQPRLHAHSDSEEDGADDEGRLLAGGKKRGVVVVEEGLGRGIWMDDAPVNDANRWKVKGGVESVPVDEKFFYEFFKDKRGRASQKNKKKGKGNDDEDEVMGDADSDADEADEEVKGEDVEDVDAESDGDPDEPDMDGEALEEEEIWEAMRRSAGMPSGAMPEDDDDVELDMDAFEDDEDEDEEGEEEDSEGEDDDEDDWVLAPGVELEDVKGKKLPAGQKSKSKPQVRDDDDNDDDDDEEDPELLSMIDEESSEDDEGDQDDQQLATTAEDDILTKGNISKTKARKLHRIAAQAAKLGYTGSFFKRAAGIRAEEGTDASFMELDEDEGLEGAFASAEDFEELIEKGEMGGFGEEGGEDEEAEESEEDLDFESKKKGKPVLGKRRFGGGGGAGRGGKNKRMKRR
ncbi:hypothetical protein HDV05_003020 [Chytridiales sp. JEL 0842]|nr:hypothetical protein HDV05_003020 [Chytridiales sp. JEL 0842]